MNSVEIVELLLSGTISEARLGKGQFEVMGEVAPALPSLCSKEDEAKLQVIVEHYLNLKDHQVIVEVERTGEILFSTTEGGLTLLKFVPFEKADSIFETVPTAVELKPGNLFLPDDADLTRYFRTGVLYTSVEEAVNTYVNAINNNAILPNLPIRSDKKVVQVVKEVVQYLTAKVDFPEHKGLQVDKEQFCMDGEVLAMLISKDHKPEYLEEYVRFKRHGKNTVVEAIEEVRDILNNAPNIPLSYLKLQGEENEEYEKRKAIWKGIADIYLKGEGLHNLPTEGYFTVHMQSYVDCKDLIKAIRELLKENDDNIIYRPTEPNHVRSYSGTLLTPTTYKELVSDLDRIRLYFIQD